MLRILRGIIGTAITFAVPWAILGGTLVVVLDQIFQGRPLANPLSYSLSLFGSGAIQIGFFGFAVGAGYAAILAVTGRKLSFDQLTAWRVLGLGVLGGAAVSGGLLALIAASGGGWHTGYSVALGVSTILGGGSSLTMLGIARRGSTARIVGDSSPDGDRLIGGR